MCVRNGWTRSGRAGGLFHLQVRIAWQPSVGYGHCGRGAMPSVWCHPCHSKRMAYTSCACSGLEPRDFAEVVCSRLGELLSACEHDPELFMGLWHLLGSYNNGGAQQPGACTPPLRPII